jgi:hypothetical protein
MRQESSSALNSALTRWINQGLARGECPLCRVAHKAEKEFLWFFFDEYSTQEAALDQLRAAHGFCSRHAAGLRRIEVDNLKSTLGISETYEDTLTGIVEELAGLGQGRALRRAPCPACAYRDEALAKNAGHLVTMLVDDGRARERFSGSPGLCMPHFADVWATDPPGRARDLLLDVQLRAAGGLRDELTEHIRKQGAEARDEVPGPEADAWQRALWFTSGWPGALEAP